MKHRLFAPRSLWFALIFTAIAGMVYGTLDKLDPHWPVTRTIGLLTHPLNFVAYGLGFFFCRRIALDFQAPSGMRLAWNLMAASSVMAIVRYGYELYVGIFRAARNDQWVRLIVQHAAPNASLLLLLGSLIAMWSSFAVFGLGFKLRRAHLYLIVFLLLMAPPVLWVSESYREGRGLYAMLWNATQITTPLLLAASGAVGVLLFSISEEMGRGHLSKSLHYLVAFVAIRLASLLVNAYPQLTSTAPLNAIRVATWWSIPWLFALAMVYRWQLTVEMSDTIRELESEPDMALPKSAGVRR